MTEAATALGGMRRLHHRTVHTKGNLT